MAATVAIAKPVPASPARIMVVSGNDEFRRGIAGEMATLRREANEAAGGAEALLRLEEGGYATVMLDRHLPDLDAGELAAWIREQYPEVELVMMDSGPAAVATPGAPAGFGAATAATPAARAAAMGGLVWQGEAIEPLPGLIGEGATMAEIAWLVRLVAPRRTAVLLTGESGTGKEMVARAIHENGSRAQRPMVVINCAAIPESLLESELFGYAKGAFTGAGQPRLGRIHAAHGGTLFLDEIGEMPLNMQAKLLRFLQEGEVQRLGSNDSFRVDVRVIAATNMQLEAKVARGEFRQDLYYRLAVFPIELKPLRARVEDILPLAEHFLGQLAAEGGVKKHLGAAARLLLEGYGWPGNVRELQHAMERAFILAHATAELLPDHFPSLRAAASGTRDLSVN